MSFCAIPDVADWVLRTVTHQVTSLQDRSVPTHSSA